MQPQQWVHLTGSLAILLMLLATTPSTADRNDAGALRGLILTHLALGRDKDLPDEIKQYAKDAPHGVEDRFLLQIIARLTATESMDFQKTLYEFAPSPDWPRVS